MGAQYGRGLVLLGRDGPGNDSFTINMADGRGTLALFLIIIIGDYPSNPYMFQPLFHRVSAEAPNGDTTRGDYRRPCQGGSLFEGISASEGIKLKASGRRGSDTCRSWISLSHKYL
jgi:hypothetical protein